MLHRWCSDDAATVQRYHSDGAIMSMCMCVWTGHDVPRWAYKFLLEMGPADAAAPPISADETVQQLRGTVTWTVVKAHHCTTTASPLHYHCAMPMMLID